MNEICKICGKPIKDIESYHQDNEGNYYHDDCLDDSDDFFVCPDCDTVFPMDEAVGIDDGDFFVCSDCAENNYIQCGQCCCYFSEDYITDVEGDSYCRDCLDNEIDRGNIEICGDCGRYFYIDNLYYVDFDDCYYCNECCDECRDENVDIIRDYHNNPPRIMFPCTDEPHFGIELEVDDGDNPNDLATALKDLLGNHTYYMHDGSLNNGVEIITQPHTPEEFYKLPWDKVLTMCKDKDFRSHDSKTCGLHMHVSRTLFKGDDSIYRITYFYEHYITDILKMSRRTHEQMERWANIYGWGDKTFAELLSKSNLIPVYNYGDHLDRYHAVNLTNDYTIEFRLMRGTLNYNTFMATIDFLWTTANNAAKMTNDDVTNAANYLKGIKKETLDYLHSRNAFLEVDNTICA